LLTFGAIAAAPVALGEYHLALVTYVGLSAIVALGLVLLTGKAGLSSFGQAAFVGIGAYISAVLTLRTGISPWLTLPLSLLAAGIAAWAAALVVVRLSGHYLSLATIAFGVAMFYLFGGLDITGGQSGLAGIPGLSIGGFAFSNALPNYVFVWAVLLGLIAMMANLLDSRMGRAIRALKDGELMAEAMGIDTADTKTSVFVIACVMAGFVGWFYAHFQRFVNPSAFSLGQGIEYLFMAVLGGANLLWGAVAGAAIVTLLKPILQAHLPGLIGMSGNFEGVVFGIVVILLFQFATEGLLPRLRRALRWPDITPRALAAAARLPARTRQSAPSLIVTGARKAFGGIVANADVTLTLHGGEIVALIGPNGAGKSTFFDLITGITKPDAGAFMLNGHPIAGCSSREIARRGVSRTFQHVRLIADMSVLENVAIGAHSRGTRGIVAAMLRLDRSEEHELLFDAWRQLERVGLAKFAWNAAGSLSLGQQRILEIARALAGDPQFLLLDEPAAGLRHQEKQVLGGFIRGLRDQGLAVLLVEHDMDFVMTLADRVVVMEFGRVIASGAPRDVQNDARVQAAYLGLVE
jgi:branched-chain amino acid transport system permease protein